MKKSTDGFFRHLDGRGFLLVAVLAVVLAVVLVVGAPALALSDSSSCEDCHSTEDGGDQKIFFDWKDSIHARSGISCHDCHGGDPGGVDEDDAMDSERGFLGVPTKAQIPEHCARCHSDPVRMKKYNIRLDQHLLYQSSKHGIALAAGNTDVAVCSTCHGAHDIFKSDDPRAHTERKKVPKLCATCHADKELMDKHDLPSDQYDQYKKSYHGKLLLEKDDVRAPNCASCHGNHGAVAPGAGSLPEVCHTCHATIADYYKQSVHNEVFQDFGEPVCNTCHGDHDVSYPSDDMLVGAGKTPCKNCHEEGGKPLLLAQKINRDITRARKELKAVATLIKKAEGYGMDPVDAREDLLEARSKFLEAIPATHSMQSKIISPFFRDFWKMAAKAREATQTLLDDHATRRKALLYVSMGLFAVVLLLVLRLFQAYKEQGLPFFGWPVEKKPTRRRG